MPTTLGVCSWSLQPASPADLIDKVQQTGCNAVQLHLDPLREDWSSSETASRLSESGIKAVSGMMTMEGEDYTTLETIKATGGVRCDDTWPANREAAEHNAALAASLGIQLVTFHAGWIPHESDSSERAVMIDRVRELGRIFAQSGVAVSLETGQETAQTLLGVLDELPDIDVNFDPANMILYGMGDPIEAIETLGFRIAQLHIKDADPARTPGTWGTELPVGTGSVDWARFLETTSRVCPGAAAYIEREAGEQRVRDVIVAREHIASLSKAIA